MTKEEIIDNLNYQNEKFFGRQSQTLIEAVKLLEQQPCEDCISRQAIVGSIDSIREHHGGMLDVKLVATQLPPVTPKIATSEDCISRERAVKAMTDWYLDMLENGEGKDFINILDALPPVTPTQRWIPLVWDEYPTVDSDGNDDYVYAVDYFVPMPKEDEWVLITDENHNVVSVQYDGYDFGDYARENILAWQPLPKPYEEK